MLYGLLCFDVTFLFTPWHKKLHFLSWTFPCISFGFGSDICWPTDVIRVECYGGAFDSAKNHKRQRRKRQSVTAKREKSQTPKFV